MESKVIPLFFGTVRNKSISWLDENVKRRWDARLGALDGMLIQVSIEPKKKKRSWKQNNYYWGAILPIVGEATGFTEEEAHDALKHKFLVIKGDKLDKVRSTVQLSTGEFTEYIMKITQWGSEFLGIEKWPEPDEYYDTITNLISHEGDQG